MPRLLCFCVALAFVAACGSGDVSDAPRTTDTQEETAPEPVPAAQAMPAGHPLGAPGENSIVDYFYAHYGTNTALFGDAMQHLTFEVKDEANGYLEVAGAFEGWITMVLWRKADGNDLVGIAEIACATTCSQDLTFYDYGAEGPRIVTDTVLPAKDAEQHFVHMDSLYLAENPRAEEGEMVLWYELPQQGTSITVAMNNDIDDLYIPIMELGWDRARFSVAKTIDTLPPDQ